MRASNIMRFVWKGTTDERDFDGKLEQTEKVVGRY